MSSVVISGNTSGTITLDAPAVAGTTTLTLPTTSGTVLTTASTVTQTLPAFSAYAGSSQSFSRGTLTLVQCNTESFDTNGCFNNTGSTVTLNGLSVPAYAFCPNVAGYYIISGNTMINCGGGAGQVLSSISKNGAPSSYVILGSLGANDGTNGYSSLSGTIYLNGTGDYIQLYMNGFQTTSATPSTTVSNVGWNFFSAAFIRSA